MQPIKRVLSFLQIPSSMSMTNSQNIINKLDNGIFTICETLSIDPNQL